MTKIIKGTNASDVRSCSKAKYRAYVRVCYLSGSWETCDKHLLFATEIRTDATIVLLQLLSICGSR